MILITYRRMAEARKTGQLQLTSEEWRGIPLQLRLKLDADPGIFNGMVLNIAPSKSEEVYEPQAVLERYTYSDVWVETLES